MKSLSISGKTNVLPRSKKFEYRAVEVSKSVRLIDPIRGRTANAIQEGNALRQSFRQILVAADVPENAIEAMADQLIGAVTQRMSEVMTDAHLPGRNDVAASFIRGLLQDPQIAAILR